MQETIISLLHQASRRFGDKLYLCEKTNEGWQGLGYREVLSEVRSLAAGLLEWNVPGSVAILSEGRISWVLTEMASFMAGKTTVPLSIKLQAEEIPYRINHAEVGLIVCSRLSVEKVLSCWAKFDHPVRLLYLDDSLEEFQTAIEPHNLKAGGSLLSLKELLQRGRDCIAQPDWQLRLAASERAIEPHTAATISYTSGTTGNPKGITLSHRNYVANVRNSLAHFSLIEGSRMFVVLPVDHAYAHTIALYAPLEKHFTLYFVDARGGATGIARNILPNMVETKPHLMLTVPSLTAAFMGKIVSGVKEKGALIYWLFEQGLRARIYMNGSVWKRPWWPLRIFPWFPAAIAELLIFRKVRNLFGPNFSYTISGGALLETKQQEFFKAIGIVVYQGYGLSEASPVVSTNTEGQHKIGSSGRVIPNVSCRIFNEHGKELPPGQKGEICLKGDTIMLGYWKNPEATAEAFRGGWLHTGDIGYLDSDGFLYVVGREKALLIMEDGEKYSPEEIEEAIVACSRGRILQTLLFCDHQKYVGALVVVNPEEYRALGAAAFKMLLQDFEAFRKDSRYANRFPRQWLPKTFALLAEPFSEANGQINSTLKMVRRTIVGAYADEISYCYTPDGSTANNAFNQKRMSEILGPRSAESGGTSG